MRCGAFFPMQESKWDEFRKLYLRELENKNEILKEILAKSENAKVTLLYAAKNETHNNAAVLKEYLEKMKS